MFALTALKIWFPVLFLAIVGIGARFSASNPAYTAAELDHHLRISEAKFVITENVHLPVVYEAARKNDIAHSHIFLRRDEDEDENENHISLQKLLVRPFAKHASCSVMFGFDNEQMSKYTIAVLCSTSGTTGLPKVAAKSHHSLVTESEAIEDSVMKPYQVRRLLTVPFFHGFGFPLAVLSVLRFGHTTYVMRQFEQSQFLGAIDRYNITETAMPPPLIVRFLGMPKEDCSALRSLKLVWTGGAPLKADTQDAALGIFGHKARIVQVWGMTEAGWFTTFQYPERDSSGSVGRLLATYDAKVIDEHGNKVTGSEQKGEILVRGPMNMLGYHNDPESTDSTITEDGWLRTGDLGTITEDGKIYIVDRLKDLIKLRAWQVSPAELESRLLAHDDILDAAVIGIPFPEEATELPRAYIVRRADSSPQKDEIKDFMMRSLAKHKVRECQIRFCDSIPKSATGKILKKVLREAAAKEGKAC